MVHWKNFPFCRIPKKRFWKSGIDPFLYWRQIMFSKIFEVQQVTNSHRLKQNEKKRKGKRKKSALAGNRTLASRVAGENSTTEPPVLCMAKYINKLKFNHVDIYSNWQNKSGFCLVKFDLRWQLIVRISTSINKIQVSLHNDNLYNNPRWFPF